MTWPSTNVPATAPTDHGDVRTQAYQAGGGDYFRSGYYSHGLFAVGAMVTGPGQGAGTAIARPYFVPVRRSFDRIGVNLVTAAAAASGAVLRMGIYSDSGGRPSSLVVDGGTVLAESAGSKEVVISQTLDPGLWWLVVAHQVTGGTGVSCYASMATPWVSPGTAPPSAITGAYYFSLGVISGALPATATVTTPSTGGSYYAVCLRAA